MIMNSIRSRYLVMSGGGWKFSSSGIACMAIVFLLGFQAGDAQSISRARSKIFYDPAFISSLSLYGSDPEQLRRFESRNEETFVDNDTQEESLVDEYDPDTDVSPEEEEAARVWKGYLCEKGPSKIIIRFEKEQELQPLSEDVWALIAGNKPSQLLSESSGSGEPTPVDEDNGQNPNMQMQMDDLLAFSQDTNEMIGIDRGSIGNESDAYLKLMELFSRPVLAMPLLEDYKDGGVISFLTPKSSTSALIRNGSRARFEIRKN
jgi:hypothetical protein